MGWKAAGLDVVVSLLEPDEISELGLRREAELCRAQGIAFISFPIADRGLPKSHKWPVLSPTAAPPAARP
jgi:hypothetical protein